MVAYNFHPRFADAVASGRKRQTIRGHRKRHARVGEPVQLYTGMRTRDCRKLVDPDPVCVAVELVEIRRDGIELAGREVICRDIFARDDGFADWPDMRAWWDETHGPEPFEGVLIRWG